MRNIPFNIPPATGREPEYLAKAIANHKPEQATESAA